MHSTELRAADGRVAVSVAAAHQGVYDALLQRRRMQKLPKRVLEGDEYPPICEV
jgi:hypothetical protein